MKWVQLSAYLPQTLRIQLKRFRFEALERCFEEDDLDSACLFSFCTDGASAMLGSVSGVATRLKLAWNPVLLIVHCIAHRGALAVGDAFKDNAVAHTFEGILRNLLVRAVTCEAKGSDRERERASH